MRLAPKDIESLRGLIEDLCGIDLDDSKKYLIESRLWRVFRDSECNSGTEFVDSVRRNLDQSLNNEIVDAITTRETSFFRDNTPFDILRHHIVPEICARRAKNGLPPRLRVWSAGCSTGQEAYSVAITLLESLPDDWDFQIVGNDISETAISRATAGHYTRYEIARGLPPEAAKKYFHEKADGWHVRDILKDHVSFRARNLVETLDDMPIFDVILCRNVVMYWSLENRKTVFNRLRSLLSQNGYLLVGTSESLIDLGPCFRPRQYCGGWVYRPNQPTQLSQAPIRPPVASSW